jgi:hypothetical protein
MLDLRTPIVTEPRRICKRKRTKAAVLNPGVLGVEVLAYHTLGTGKYRAIGLAYPLDGLAPPEAEHVARARAVLAKAGAEIVDDGGAPPDGV